MGFGVPYAIVFSELLLYVVGVESDRPYIGMALVSGPIVYFAMLRNITETDISVGRAGMITSSALWGGVWGLLGTVAVGGNDEDGGRVNPRVTTAITLLVSVTALAAATVYTETHDISPRRVKLINIGGVMGSALGLGIPYLLNTDNSTVYLAGLLIGGITGTVGAFSATKFVDEPRRGVSNTANASGLRLFQPRTWSRSAGPGDVRADVRWGVSLAEYHF